VSYTPQVGDKIRHESWDNDRHARITAIGESVFLAVDTAGNELRYAIDSRWERYVEPVVYPQLWINIYRDGTGEEAGSRWGADRCHQTFQADRERIGVLRLRTDGETEMEAP
jgi:hypothetical protein